MRAIQTHYQNHVNWITCSLLGNSIEMNEKCCNKLCASESCKVTVHFIFDSLEWFISSVERCPNWFCVPLLLMWLYQLGERWRNKRIQRHLKYWRRERDPLCHRPILFQIEYENEITINFNQQISYVDSDNPTRNRTHRQYPNYFGRPDDGNVEWAMIQAQYS